MSDRWDRGSRAGSPAGNDQAKENGTPTALEAMVSRVGRAGVMRRIQRRRARAHAAPADNQAVVQSAADQGTRGAGGALPHQEAIQRSFGKHDVSRIRAHTDEGAKQASQAIGAEAFASGTDVAFADAAPSLHTAAHEAAHVIQQKGGVQLAGGVGEEGDPHEQHADAVADRVVGGQSAEDLLDQGAGGAPAVQRKINYQSEDSAQSLKERFPGQTDEIDGWERSPFLVDYQANDNALGWSLDPGSDGQIGSFIEGMVQPEAEALAGLNEIAGQLWMLIQKHGSKWQYQESIQQNFRALLLLQRSAKEMAELFSNVHGEVRKQLIKRVQDALRGSLGRPILEDDQVKDFLESPGRALQWASYGWGIITNNWSGIAESDRPKFAERAFAHNKGYNRGTNFISNFVSPESTGGRLLKWSRDKGMGKVVGQPIELFAKVIAFYSFNGKYDCQVSVWRKHLTENAVEIADALVDLGVSEQQVSEFANSPDISHAVRRSGFDELTIDDIKS